MKCAYLKMLTINCEVLSIFVYSLEFVTQRDLLIRHIPPLNNTAHRPTHQKVLGATQKVPRINLTLSRILNAPIANCPHPHRVNRHPIAYCE